MATSFLVESVSQFGTGLELCHFLGGNLYLFLRCRVDTLTSRTLVYAERTKANKGNLVTGNKSFLYSGYGGVESFLGISLGNIGTSCDLFD